MKRATPEYSRGVYIAERASALAGVPKSTVYYWARSGLLVPSVSPERVKLWSWADLVALRAVYWLRHPILAEVERSPTSMRRVRTLIEIVEEEAGGLGDALASSSLKLRVDKRGVPYLDVSGRLIEAGRSWKQLVGRELVLDLLDAFEPEAQLSGPNLVRPRLHLRIVPGKLAGEPHVDGTRIETRVLAQLERRGFTNEQVLALYPELTERALEESVDLERQLEHNLEAA